MKRQEQNEKNLNILWFGKVKKDDARAIIIVNIIFFDARYG